MIKPKTTWSFTDQPDMFRICRELREAGCALGTATRADGVVTLVDVDALNMGAVFRFQAVPKSERFNVFGSWYCAKGDHVASILKVSPVTVRGYKPSATGGL